MAGKFTFFTCEGIFEPPIPHGNSAAKGEVSDTQALSTLSKGVSFPGMEPPDLSRKRAVGPAVAATFMSIARPVFEDEGFNAFTPNALLKKISEGVDEMQTLLPKEAEFIGEWLNSHENDLNALIGQTAQRLVLGELLLHLITFYDRCADAY